MNSGAYTIAPTNYTFGVGTGSDAGNIVVTLVPATDATHGAYIELGGKASAYDVGTDISL